MQQKNPELVATYASVFKRNQNFSYEIPIQNPIQSMYETQDMSINSGFTNINNTRSDI